MEHQKLQPDTPRSSHPSFFSVLHSRSSPSSFFFNVERASSFFSLAQCRRRRLPASVRQQPSFPPPSPQVGYPLQIPEGIEASAFTRKQSVCRSFKRLSVIPRCSSTDDKNESSDQNKTPFGYSRKDVLLIGVGVTLIGVGLKSGLEFYGVDPLQAGNVVQLVIVLGLTVGWISTYMFRVSNKEMTYATQLRDYEKKVMEKRLESLTEAELAVLMEQVEEEKQERVPSNDKVG